MPGRAFSQGDQQNGSARALTEVETGGGPRIDGVRPPVGTGEKFVIMSEGQIIQAGAGDILWRKGQPPVGRLLRQTHVRTMGHPEMDPGAIQAVEVFERPKVLGEADGEPVNG